MGVPREEGPIDWRALSLPFSLGPGDGLGLVEGGLRLIVLLYSAERGRVVVGYVEKVLDVESWDKLALETDLKHDGDADDGCECSRRDQRSLPV